MAKKRHQWPPSEVKAIRAQMNKTIGAMADGEKVTLRTLSRDVHKNLFPTRSISAIEVAMKRRGLWKATGSRNLYPAGKMKTVKAHKCQKCGHLTEVV